MNVEAPAGEPWRQFLCRACGLVYDEAEGDPDSGLPPGTRFADIPEDWACPICGVTKTDFEPYVRREPAVAAPAGIRNRHAGVVIVGAGAAGWGVAAALRRLDASVPITLVTACNGDLYNKPELSVALTRGLSPEALRRETGAAAAARLGVALLPDTQAVGLSAALHRLRTTRGTLPYTALVLAQGARPVEAPNLPAALCWRINDLRAWSGLHAALSGGPKRVAIVGAGLVGCELAEDMARAGHAVTLLARADRPLARLLPERAARRLAEGFGRSGIAFRGGTRVRAVEPGDGGTRRLSFEDGGAIEADVVIAALGLATPSRLVRSAGLAFDNGIAVDPATLRSSAADVYALGDCASIGGMACRFIEPIARQAEAVAHAILDRAHSGYAHASPVIRLKSSATPIVIHGAPGAGEWRVVEESADRLAMEQWRDGVVAVRLAA